MHEGFLNGYVNGAFNAVGCNRPPDKRISKLLNEPEMPFMEWGSEEIPFIEWGSGKIPGKETVQTSLGHEIKHARVSPSISQQVKIGNLSSTLRPNQ